MSDEWIGWRPNGGLLEGKVAVVAGAAGVGIGGKVTQILAAAGATVVAIDLTEEGATAAAERVIATGGKAFPVVANLLDQRQCEGAITKAAELAGGFDILANIAGGMSAYASWAPFQDTTDDAWNGIVSLNLGYVFWSCRAAIPIIAARGGGAIVNIGTVAAMFGSPGQAAYGAAKAAVVQLTRTLAVECGPLGIRANSVSPGVTLNAVTSEKLGSEASQPWQQVTPLRKLGVPEDIARAVLYFASPMSEQVTGQSIAVDGGVSANFPYPGLGESH